MLLITRKVNETIKIGQDIELKVCRVTKSIVTLGITAPKDKLILRSELENEKKEISLCDLPSQSSQSK